MQWVGFSRGIRKALSRCACQSENMEPGLPENQLQQGRRIGKVALETQPMLTQEVKNLVRFSYITVVHLSSFSSISKECMNIHPSWCKAKNRSLSKTSPS